MHIKIIITLVCLVLLLVKYRCKLYTRVNMTGGGKKILLRCHSDSRKSADGFFSLSTKLLHYVEETLGKFPCDVHVWGVSRNYGPAATLTVVAESSCRIMVMTTDGNDDDVPYEIKNFEVATDNSIFVPRNGVEHLLYFLVSIRMGLNPESTSPGLVGVSDIVSDLLEKLSLTGLAQKT